MCDEMKTVIQRVEGQAGSDARLTLTEVDISNDPELERRWGSEIPVLLHEGQEIARHRISVSRLTDAISQLP